LLDWLKKAEIVSNSFSPVADMLCVVVHVSFASRQQKPTSLKNSREPRFSLQNVYASLSAQTLFQAILSKQNQAKTFYGPRTEGVVKNHNSERRAQREVVNIFIIYSQ